MVSSSQDLEQARAADEDWGGGQPTKSFGDLASKHVLGERWKVGTRTFDKYI